MVNKPGHGNTLHPCSDQRNALPTEKQPVIPVLKRAEYYFESIPVIPGSNFVHQFFS
jgi:hypothetical protein